MKDVPGAELKSCAARDVQKAKQCLGRWMSRIVKNMQMMGLVHWYVSAGMQLVVMQHYILGCSFGERCAFVVG